MTDATHSERNRSRRTRRSVHLWDRLAERVISLGGALVLASVLAICVYLAWVVRPLFTSGRAELVRDVTPDRVGEPLGIIVDEYRAGAATLDADGSLAWRLLRDGRTIGSARLIPEGRSITSIASTPGQTAWAIGLDDGSVMVGRIDFASRLLSQGDIEEIISKSVDVRAGIDALGVGEAIEIPAGLVASLIPGTGVAPETGGWIEAIESSGTFGAGALQLRVSAPRWSFGEPTSPAHGAGAAIRVDIAESSAGRVIAEVRADGSAMVHRVIERRPLGGGPTRIRLVSRSLELEGEADFLFVTEGGEHVISIARDGFAVRYGASRADDPASALTRVERARVVPEGRAVISAAKLTGSKSILVGDDAGGVHVWFVGNDPLAPTRDQMRFVSSVVFDLGDAPILGFALSARERVFVAWTEEGRAEVAHATSAKRIASIDLIASPEVLAISPKGDALAVLASDDRLRLWNIDARFPGASMRSLFGAIRYEDSLDATRGEYVYQSTSASDTSEAKISLVPLIFGTLKATVFAMLLAAPIAVLAALYTSEFMHPRVRRYVKPGLELMATLPSVVLGFVAAMFIAPILRDNLAGVLLAFVITPAVVYLGATVWRGTHPATARVEDGRTRTVGVLSLLLIGAAASFWMAPPVERALFAPSRQDVLIAAGSVEAVAPEDVPSWAGVREAMGPADQRRLACEGLAFLPGAGVVRAIEPGGDVTGDGAADERDRERFTLLHAQRDPSADLTGDGAHDDADLIEFASRYERTRALEQTIVREDLARAGLIRWLNGEIRDPTPGWLAVLTPALAIALFLVRGRVMRAIPVSALGAGARGGAIALSVVLSTLCAVGIAFLLSRQLSSACVDLRDSVLGPFTQRNTLVVAIVMGVAIIPIIYTISEDAMRSVPDSLRLASLGSGATPWQTAIRVVLPVAGSGIFSACMIGLGRAVGETMIVLMATGSTPEMSWNIFSGFRTLAANIAMELSEAPKGETLYRVLFLCGLVLFLMTFAVNTTAEIVRIRFRRRSAAL